MDAILQPLLGGGVTGIMLAFFIYYVNKKDKEHREERKEWTNQLVEIANKTTAVVDDNTRAMVNIERTMGDVVKAAKCNYQNLRS